MGHHYKEDHYIFRVTWLRAAVLGANDGIISISSLIIGVAAASVDRPEILLAATAAVVAGALSMAAGEYVSVSSQADLTMADYEREVYELEHNWEHELDELTHIYIERGLEADLAATVAKQLMKKDALSAHLRDELGLSEYSEARPLEAAFSSALAFFAGAALPLLVTMFSPMEYLVEAVSVTTIFSLMSLGAISGKLGGAKILRPTLRVTLWGILAMGFTFLVGQLFS